MIRGWQILGAALLAAVVCCACNPGTPEVKTYQVKIASGVDQAKQLLERYANGSPLGSEVTSFPQLVSDVKKTDAQKGELLENGLADLQKGGDVAAKAKELLKQL